MSNNLISHIIRFFVLILLQVYVLNNILFFNIINPYVYIYFILLLPFELPPFAVTFLSFLMGISIDFFSGTIALNALASTVIGFLRPYILKLFSPYDGYEKNTAPTIAFYNLNWWFKYSLFITIIHHSILFFTETFHFKNIFFTLLKIIASSSLSIFLMILMQYFFHKKSKNL